MDSSLSLFMWAFNSCPALLFILTAFLLPSASEILQITNCHFVFWRLCGGKLLVMVDLCMLIAY
ncbi:hypothetical protein HNQ59_003003 [Chitinivorax tropicus]|uniref:Uncharacterized protein n=1 Tax=Chitinivorax tropicus TaxID=714531 RepID=A0A840MQI0_9PROT|nr:hypothetical protein [Chitinivorax tropicus]